MSSNSSRAGFIGRDTQLSSLVARVDALGRVLDTLRRAAPPELAPLLMGVAWSGSTLVVALPHSAAAARLRMVAPSLLKALQVAGWQATAIRPQVQVALQREKPQLTKRLAMSDQAVEAFSGLAQDLGDEGLRNAVLDLVRHHQQRKSR